MASKRDQLLKQIADLKEERNVTILKHAPADDARAGQSHPDVRALEERIAELRGQVAALDDQED